MRIDKAELRVWSVCFFCPEQWRLQHGLGLEPANRQELAAGDRHHARKAVAERIAGGSITLGAVLALLLGLWLILAGRGMRQRRGLGGGKTLLLDNVTLTSRRLGLTGRPDRQ